MIGAWAQAGIVNSTGNYDDNGNRSSNAGLTAFYAIDGVVQGAGFIMLLVGMASGPDKIEKQPVYVGGAVIPGGAGVSASGHF